jgi:8-oxo-dGTP pyrophosphatase MutT (NUDIX family)
MQSDPQPWKVEASEYLHRSRWLTLRRDAVRLPNGAAIPDYYVLEYPDWINVLAVTTQNELVLLRQYRHGLGETHFELCAGGVEAGEDPLECARRELLEETGFGGGVWQPWMTLAANPGTHTNRIHAFLATDVELMQPPALEATEEISVHLLSLERAREAVERGEVIQSLFLAPLYKYFLSQSP